MVPRTLVLFGVCGALVAAQAAEPAPPAAVLLRIQFRPGLTWKATYTRHTAQLATSGDGTVERMTETLRAVSEGKVLRVDGDRATIEAQVKSGSIATKTDDGPEESEDLPTAKDTITLTTRDQVLSHTDEEGNELKAAAGSSLGPETGHGPLVLPEKEVRAGDTWEYRMQAEGSEESYTKVKCTLTRFVTYAGRPCVEITGEYQIVIASPKAEDQPPGMSFENEGTITATFTLYFDYGRGHTLAGTERTNTVMRTKFKFTTPDGEESDEYTVAARSNEQYVFEYAD